MPASANTEPKAELPPSGVPLNTMMANVRTILKYHAATVAMNIYGIFLSISLVVFPFVVSRILLMPQYSVAPWNPRLALSPSLAAVL